MTYRVLDLFSGIGGFSLGLERTGRFKTVAFCEIEPFCRLVLAKHWPDVFIHDDIRTLTKDTLCSGYAENALLNQLCRETGGSSQSAKFAITNIKKAAELRTPRATTLGRLSAEDELSNIMGAVAPVVGSENTHFWQSIINLITATQSVQHTKALFGNSLSNEDFQTITKFFVTTAIWRNQSTAPAHINEILRTNGYDDVRTLTADHLAADGIAVDVICGGFPCQDVSLCGDRAGLDGARSGLWGEYARLVRDLRPKFVIVENVTGLLSLGMGTVLGDLASLGYDAEWESLSAASIGALHVRDRVWVLAYPNEVGCALPSEQLAHVRQVLRQGISAETVLQVCGGVWSERVLAGLGLPDGIPTDVDAVGAFGNAVVPQIPELIGRAILASLEEPA